MLASHHKKLLAVRVRCGKCLLMLTRVRNSPPTMTMGATVGLGMIVQSTGLAVVATDARDSSADAATAAGAGGPGIASPLIFSAS